MNRNFDVSIITTLRIIHVLFNDHHFRIPLIYCKIQPANVSLRIFACIFMRGINLKFYFPTMHLFEFDN